MEKLGKTIGKIFKDSNKTLSHLFVLDAGIQMIKRLDCIHSQGIIHRDIKPENYLYGLDSKIDTLYLIDFGLSKRYKDIKTGFHIPYRDNRSMLGTVRYVSINTHLGIE